MATMTRPDKALTIEDLKTMKMGARMYHLYGGFLDNEPKDEYQFLWSRPHTKGSRDDCPETSSQKDKMVFDVCYTDEDGMVYFSSMDKPLVVNEFCSDGNMEPGKSHNDNYWFATYQDMLDGREQMLASKTVTYYILKGRVPAALPFYIVWDA